LRDDIEDSQQRLQESGKEAMFQIDKIDLEARMIVKKEAGGKAGVKLYFVTVGGGVKYATEEVHTIKLSFSPLGPTEAAGPEESGRRPS
jgi:hypothetical protein